MLEGGYVLLFRSLLKWEWYRSINTTRLFVHLLLTVNYEDRNWKGITIKRGQRVCSVAELAKESSITYQQCRTSLTNLISTGELTRSTCSKYTLLTVNNYDDFQSLTRSLTNKQRDDNEVVTNKQPQWNKSNESNEEMKAIKEYEATGGASLPHASQAPPQTDSIELPKKASKKPSEPKEVDALISNYASNDAELLNLLQEWHKVRKAKRAPNTVKAIELNLKALPGMAQQSNMTQADYLREVIMRGWQAFYAINNYNAKPNQSKPARSPLEDARAAMARYEKEEMDAGK